MLSIIVLRKNIGIGKNQYRQVTLQKIQFSWNQMRKLQSVDLFIYSQFWLLVLLSLLTKLCI